MNPLSQQKIISYIEGKVAHAKFDTEPSTFVLKNAKKNPLYTARSRYIGDFVTFPITHLKPVDLTRAVSNMRNRNVSE